MTSCSGPKGGNVCKVNCGGGGTANLSFTMVADTLPTTPSLLNFEVVVLGVTVTSSTSTKTLTPSSAPIDLMRLQSDSAFLGTLTSVPSETISSLTVALSSQKMTIFNDTGVALTSPACPVNAICTFNPNAVGSVLINNVNQTFSSNTGLGLDFNLASAVTVTGTTLNVNFSPASGSVLTEFTLPRAGSNLTSGQLDLIEDVTGVATVSGQNATIKNPLTNASLTAAATSSTVFDTDPADTLCPTSAQQTLATCVSNNQIASMDVIVNSDGTTSIREIEPLLATQQDVVEGIVAAINSGSSTQFTLIVTDMLPAASNSLIGNGLLSDGDGLTVNLVNASNFLIDTKGLDLSAFTGNTNTFTTANNTGALHLGQRVAVHVTQFTGPSGTTLASVNADALTLRWSRFAASVSSTGTPAFNITALPSYFLVSGAPQVQTFNQTSLDGITSTGNLSSSLPVYIRALYIENSGFSLQPAFYAAKVRQH